MTASIGLLSTLVVIEEQSSLSPSEEAVPDAAELREFQPTTIGDLAPWFTFEGREQALGYIGTIFKNLSQVKLVERTTYVADDGQTAFVEAKGDLIQRDTNASYRNVYVFKLSMQDGRITHVREYANPVTFAKLMGIPLG